MEKIKCRNKYDQRKENGTYRCKLVDRFRYAYG